MAAVIMTITTLIVGCAQGHESAPHILAFSYFLEALPQTIFSSKMVPWKPTSILFEA